MRVKIRYSYSGWLRPLSRRYSRLSLLLLLQ